MKLKLLGVTCILMLLLAGSAFSAVTGKITGVITDAANQQPLVGVTVAVQGTTWGAITDVDGRYSINNVPVGTYNIIISAVGYNSIEVTAVDVHADLATYQSHAMAASVTELTTTITVKGENPLIVKDKTTSVNIVKAEEIQSMPTRGFEEIVGLQNSVVRMNSNTDINQRGGAAIKANGPSINLRGGRPSEVAYYVDGFSQQDPLSGLSTANVSNNAIQEISVTSGAFSAEYGHVASGIVNVVTKSGTDDYHFTTEAVSDNVGLSENVFDQNFYTADVSGPLPFMEKGYFYLSGERRYLQDRTPSTKTEEFFTETGLTNNDGAALPNNSLSGWSWQGKLDMNFTPTFKFTLNGNGSIDNWQQYQHFYNNPYQPSQIEHTPRYEDINYGINGKITHTLNANNYYNLSLSYFYTERFRGDGVLFRDYEAYNRDITNPELDQYSLYVEGDSVMTVDPVSGDTSYAFYLHYYDDYLIRKSSYVGVKGDFNSQLNASSTMKLGFDFQRHTLRYYRDLAPALGTLSSSNINRYGMDITGNDSDNENFQNDTKHPINLGIYIQDRFDWRGLVLNAGLRFDYFDYKTLRIINPQRPFDPNSVDPSDGTIDESDLEPSKKFTRLSPRLGISFPVSEKTQMHINYGKFFQRPDLTNLYVGYDFYEARVGAGSYFPFPSPNLEPEKITQYEIGMSHQLGDYTALDVTAYYKDVQDLTQIFHQSPGFPYVYDIYSNVDFGTIKGVDIGLTMRRNRNIQMSVKYSLSYASGTGSYSGSTYNIAWKSPNDNPKTTNPLDYDQRHTIIGLFDYRTGKGEGPSIGDYKPLENFGFNALVQLGSGTPYTPTQVYDAISQASVDQYPIGGINSANLPWTFSIDIKAEKRFVFSKFQIIPYLWVKNLLDAENVSSVYEGTGKADVTGYLETDEGQLKAQDDEYAARYQTLQENPKNYLNPRQIFAGLRVTF